MFAGSISIQIFKWLKHHNCFAIALDIRQFVSNFYFNSRMFSTDFALFSIGYHLIAFVKSWQEVVNKVAAEKEMQAFQFNTYIISVLVIFFLQHKRNFPKLGNVPASQLLSIDHVSHDNIEELKPMVTEFFHFYDTDKLICQKINVHTGQWGRGAKKRFVESKHKFMQIFETHFHWYFPLHILG